MLVCDFLLYILKQHKGLLHDEKGLAELFEVLFWFAVQFCQFLLHFLRGHALDYAGNGKADFCHFDVPSVDPKILPADPK